MLPKWFTPVIIAAVAGLSVWLLSEQTSVKPKRIVKDTKIPDSFMENVTTYLMDKTGKPQYEIEAGYVAHFPHDDHSDFTSPHVIFHSPNGEQWELSAEHGASMHGTDQIVLHGEVVMNRKQANSKNADLKIKTSELLINPASSYAETDQIITLTSGESTLQANGIRAYFDQERVELLSKVKGVYVL
jgi:lipopolysaccharide export system protein LptC